VSDAKVDGVELSYTGRLADTDLRASLTFQDPKNEATGQQLVRRAKQFGSLSAAHDFGLLRVGGEVVASGPRYDNDPYTFQRVALPGYAVVNLIARYALTSTVSLQLRVDNLFDKDYTLASGYNTQGRLVLFTVAYVPERP
jgi:vitamin B12 transporter